MNQNKPGKMHAISAVSNPRIKSVRALSQKKHRDETGTFLVEGLKLVRDAFEAGWRVETLIFARHSGLSEDFDAFAARVRVKGGDVLEVTEKVLSTITRKDNPQTVVAVIDKQWATAPQSVLDSQTVWIGLDRIRDPGNLGTIIRTADAAGVDGVILIGETTDPFSLEATRATMGSIFNVPLVRMSELEFLTWKKTWNGQTIGTHLEGAKDFRSIDYGSKPVLLVMGNEQKGLTPELAEACDTLALIPMNGRADSLNLAIATGVFLFQMGKKLPPVTDGMT